MTIENTNYIISPTKKPTRRRSSCLVTQPSYNTAKITVKHWQLRDLVQPSSARKNEILYTYEDTIRSTDILTDKVSTVRKLDFPPRCFKELDNKIVAGGVASSVNHNTSNNRVLNTSSSSWKGLLSFYDRETQQSESIRLGAHINNSVSINKVSNGLYSSYVCNNDAHLYNALINTSSIVVTNSLNLEFPLNHSVLSDDGKNLVVVGDCSNIYLIHPDQRPSEGLRRDNILETNCNLGFSTSFSTSGVQFATCFQDGTCLIYDLRNTSAGPLKKVYSTIRNSANGAFRCVKYSRGTDDLLIISEHVGRVHVIDSRDFTSHQVIMLPVDSSGSHGNETNSENESGVFRSNIFTPKIVDYNDVVSYECNNFNSTHNSDLNSPRYTSPNSAYLNNFNLLSALASNGYDVYDFGDNCEYSNVMEEDKDSTTGYNGERTATRSISESAYSDNDISGIDWYEDCYGSHIVIGCDKGLINWTVDSLSRRSFPSFSLA